MPTPILDNGVGGKRDRDRSPSPPPFDTESEAEFPALPPAQGGGDQTALVVYRAPDAASPPATTPAAKWRKGGKYSTPARADPCCPCGPRNLCARSHACPCKRVGHACTNCDPASCGKCLNTASRPPRNRLQLAFERQQRYEQERAQGLHLTPPDEPVHTPAKEEKLQRPRRNLLRLEPTQQLTVLEERHPIRLSRRQTVPEFQR